MSASRGASRERKVADELRKEGWIVKGTGDAHGVIDLIALRHDRRPRVIQVKGTKGGPYEHFGPAERRAVVLVAAMADAEAYLAWAPPDRKPTRWIHSSEWPTS